MTKTTLGSKRVPVRIMAIAGGALALLALAGCNNSSPDRYEGMANVSDDSGTNEAVTLNAAPPVDTAPAVSANAAVVEPREAPPEPDTQTLDDADATGMTARVNRGDALANDTEQ